MIKYHHGTDHSGSVHLMRVTAPETDPPQTGLQFLKNSNKINFPHLFNIIPGKGHCLCCGKGFQSLFEFYSHLGGVLVQNDTTTIVTSLVTNGRYVTKEMLIPGINSADEPLVRQIGRALRSGHIAS